MEAAAFISFIIVTNWCILKKVLCPKDNDTGCNMDFTSLKTCCSGHISWEAIGIWHRVHYSGPQISLKCHSSGANFRTELNFRIDTNCLLT